MIRHATARGAACAALLILAGTVAGCAGGGGGRAYPAGGYYSPYGNGTTQQSTCGALGTCAPSGIPRIEPGDEHGD